MHVKLQEITPDAEKTVAYIARVSNPANQANENYAKLLRYCIEHQHWSVFEHGHMTLEIETSLAIATQILRHRSFTFQQFSQRYSDASQLGFEHVDLRRQSTKNRQGSDGALPAGLAEYLPEAVDDLLQEVEHLYTRLLAAGVAKECARMILPQCTTTRLYMTGDIRSWIHYLQLRTKPDTQLEHQIVADRAKGIFVEQLPVISEALGWVRVAA